MTLEHYEKQFTKAGPDECWPWKERSRDKNGYGILSWRQDGKNNTVRAHRWGWRVRFGPIPSGLMIRHTCDSPPCQNPTHWLLGTSAENMADMKARGRGTGPGLGEKHPRAILTDAQVAEARSRYTGEVGQQTALAKEYGVSRRSMCKILTGKMRNRT